MNRHVRLRIAATVGLLVAVIGVAAGWRMAVVGQDPDRGSSAVETSVPSEPRFGHRVVYFVGQAGPGPILSLEAIRAEFDAGGEDYVEVATWSQVLAEDAKAAIDALILDSGSIALADSEWVRARSESGVVVASVGVAEPVLGDFLADERLDNWWEEEMVRGFDDEPEFPPDPCLSPDREEFTVLVSGVRASEATAVSPSSGAELDEDDPTRAYSSWFWTVGPCNWHGAPDFYPGMRHGMELKDAASPRLRVTNTGTRTIHALKVIFPANEIYFGDVPAGATTEYLWVPSGVYRYSAYEFVMDGEPYMVPVIDWFGEEPQPGELFSWPVNFDEYPKAAPRQATETP